MNTRNITRLAAYAVLAALLGFAFPACKTATDTAKGDCDRNKHVSKIGKVLHANDTGSASYFFLSTDAAKSSCEVMYNFYFRWANPDSAHSKVRPPLTNLDHSFAPGGLEGLLFYFPHPKEVLNEQLMWPAWEISFATGNKTSIRDTTYYTIFTNLESDTPLSDSVQVNCMIDFVGFEK